MEIYIDWPIKKQYRDRSKSFDAYFKLVKVIGASNAYKPQECAGRAQRTRNSAQKKNLQN